MKIKFNLQPWRENVRKAQQKKFVTTTAVITLGICALCGFNYYVESKYLDEQAEAKRLLQSKIDSLSSVEKKVKEVKEIIEEINRQIVAINSLQTRRGTALKLLDHIADHTPKSVFLDSINFDGNQLSISGVAENDTGVAEFLRVLQSSELLTTPDLREIKTAEKTDRYVIPEEAEIKSFTVVVGLVNEFKGD